MLPALLLIQLLATGFMTGLIWFVQVVHYPLFQRVGTSGFVQYEGEHVRRTTWVVAPVMIIELLIATALTLLADTPMLRSLSIAGLLLLAVIWISTMALQVPCHRRLVAGFEPAAARRLSETNWIRTLAWSARAVVSAAMVLQAAVVHG